VISLRIRHLPAATAAICALAVAGCGGSDKQSQGAKLPASAVSSLDQRLGEIQRRYAEATKNDNPGACDDIARDSFPAVKKVIDGLPQDVDSKLRDATTESFANLQQLTDKGCGDVSTPTDTTTAPTETTTPPPETTTTPPETNTTPPETTTTPPATTPQTTTPKNPSGGTGGQKPNAGSPQGGGTKAPSGNGN